MYRQPAHDQNVVVGGAQESGPAAEGAQESGLGTEGAQGLPLFCLSSERFQKVSWKRAVARVDFSGRMGLSGRRGFSDRGF